MAGTYIIDAGWQSFLPGDGIHHPIHNPGNIFNIDKITQLLAILKLRFV